METKPNILFKFKRLFVPEGKEAEFREVMPFFLLTTVALIGLSVAAIRESQALQDPPILVLFLLLAFVHGFLYWTVIRFATTERRKILFFVVQGGLIFGIIITSASVTMLIGLFCSLIGTLVGFLGRTRLTVIGLVITIFMFVMSFLLIGAMEEIRYWFPAFLAGAGVAVFFAYFFNYQMEAREKAQNLLVDLEEAHRQLTEYALEVEDLTIANERQRMARELHDTLAQGLAGLILQLEAADLNMERGNVEKSRDILQLAMERARATLVEARQAIDDLRATFSGGRSLADALTSEVARFQRAAGIPCQVSLSLPDHIEDALTEHLFRIITEGLENILRHAQADSVQLSLAQEDSSLVLDLQDDGAGFDQNAETATRGRYGLLGMRERARLAGGTLTIESELGEGTQIHAVFPLEDVDA